MSYYFTLFLFLISLSASFGQKQADEPVSYLDDLAFDWQKKEDTLLLVAKNKLWTSLQINFHTRRENVALDSFLLLPRDSVALISYSGGLSDSTFKKRFQDSIRMGYFWGHPSQIAPDQDYLYRFPFRKGKKYEVSQSFHGKTSHNSVRSKYAIDFQLNVGEPVYAARGGVVVKVIDWFTKQGGKELIHAANKIVILHSDGTLASYVHLDYQGSFVKEGQEVKRGQKIGISGLTGYTNGPHLHFVVRKENNIAIPVFFEGYPGKVLKRGRRYKVF